MPSLRRQTVKNPAPRCRTARDFLSEFSIKALKSLEKALALPPAGTLRLLFGLGLRLLVDGLDGHHRLDSARQVRSAGLRRDRFCRSSSATALRRGARGFAGFSSAGGRRFFDDGGCSTAGASAATLASAAASARLLRPGGAARLLRLLGRPAHRLRPAASAATGLFGIAGDVPLPAGASVASARPVRKLRWPSAEATAASGLSAAPWPSSASHRHVGISFASPSSRRLRLPPRLPRRRFLPWPSSDASATSVGAPSCCSPFVAVCRCVVAGCVVVTAGGGHRIAPCVPARHARGRDPCRRAAGDACGACGRGLRRPRRPAGPRLRLLRLLAWLLRPAPEPRRLPPRRRSRPRAPPARHRPGQAARLDEAFRLFGHRAAEDRVVLRRRPCRRPRW